MSALFRMDIALKRSHPRLSDLDSLAVPPQLTGKGYGTSTCPQSSKRQKQQRLNVAFCAPAAELFFFHV